MNPSRIPNHNQPGQPQGMALGKMHAHVMFGGDTAGIHVERLKQRLIQYPADTGLDLFVDSYTHLTPSTQVVKVDTGLQLYLPDGIAGLFLPRPSVVADWPRLDIIAGALVPGYFGKVFVLVRDLTLDPVSLNATLETLKREGIALAQLILTPTVMPLPVSWDTNLLSLKGRGSATMGSTNPK